jgi:hypothetical protein
MIFTRGNSVRRAQLVGVLLGGICVVVGFLPTTATAASESCTSPSGTVIDGYLGGTYVKLRTQPSPTDPSTTWICFRAAATSTLDEGGRVDVTSPSVAPQLPTIDDNFQSCSTTAGNLVPGPHPLLAGQISDASHPPYIPYSLDTYAAGGSAWVCVLAGYQKRVIVNTGGVSPPSVMFTPDVPSAPPAPAPGPTGYPSSTCQAATQGTTVQFINADVGGTRHVSIYESQPNSARTNFCVRVNGPTTSTSGGELLAIDGPVVATSTDTSPCSVTVLTVTSPVQASVTRSPDGANPVSVCVTAGATSERFTIGAPTITQTGDPDNERLP